MAARETRGARGDATQVEPPDRAVAALAEAQHGVMTRDQLLAAVLACGPDAVLSHRSAAVLWGLLRACEHPIHVTAPTHRRGPAGVRLHFSLPSESVHRDAIAVTTPARTLVDLATTASREELERALDEARLQRLVTDGDLEREASGRAGSRALRELLAAEPSFTRSEAERRLLSLLRRARLPTPHTNVRIAGHEVDALWRRERLEGGAAGGTACDARPKCARLSR